MSTDGSGEDWTLPGPTLSLHIVQFDLSWPDYENLALNIRLNGLSGGSHESAGSNVAA